MNNENMIIQGLGFEISEDKSNPDYLQGRFCVCDFDTNKNNVSLNRETIDEWVSTLVGTPLVAKIVKNFKNKEDFTSHNMKIVSVKDKDGKTHKKAVFDTSAFGVCTDVSIETSEDGNDYIYANYKIWKRFENACKIIKERANNLKTSWEICTEEFTQKVKNGILTKQIDKGRFIGLAMLGSDIEPAYDSSGLLEVASEQTDELNIALMEDLENLNISSDINTNEKEVKPEMEDNVVLTNEPVETTEISETVEVSEEDNIVETSEETVETVEQPSETEVSNEEQLEVDNVETETSALTDNDLRHRLNRAFDEIVDNEGHRYCGWCFMLFPADNTAWFRECGCNLETELIEVKYSVENDNVVITEHNKVVLTVSPREINKVIAQKDNAIVEMSAQIQSLNDKVAELQPYKDKVDEIEKAERLAKFEQDKKELANYAISSGYITQEEIETSEEIKGYIESLDKTSIKSLISDRVVANLANKVEQEVETSTSKVETEPDVQVNLMVEHSEQKVSEVSALNVIKAYIGR